MQMRSEQSLRKSFQERGSYSLKKDECPHEYVQIVSINRSQKKRAMAICDTFVQCCACWKRLDNFNISVSATGTITATLTKEMTREVTAGVDGMVPTRKAIGLPSPGVNLS